MSQYPRGKLKKEKEAGSAEADPVEGFGNEEENVEGATTTDTGTPSRLPRTNENPDCSEGP